MHVDMVSFRFFSFRNILKSSKFLDENQHISISEQKLNGYFNYNSSHFHLGCHKKSSKKTPCAHSLSYLDHFNSTAQTATEYSDIIIISYNIHRLLMFQ